MRKNQKRNFLELRGSIWYVKWDVPEDVSWAFDNRSVIKRRLSVDKKQASIMAATLVAEWKRKAYNARNEQENVEQDLREAIDSFNIGLANNNEKIILQNDERANELVKIFSDPHKADELLLSWMEVYDNHYEIVFGDYREDVIRSIVAIILYIKNSIGKEFTRGKAFDLVDLEIKYERTMQLAFIDDRKGYKKSYSITNDLFNNFDITKQVGYQHGLSDSSINDWKKAKKNSYKTSKTLNDYYGQLKRFKKFLNDGNRKLDRFSVSDFINQVSNKNKTKQRYLTTIRGYWKWAMKEQPSFYKIHKGQEDPTVDHELDRYGEGVKESYKGFEKEEIKLIFEECLNGVKPDLDLACLIAYGLYTGARLEEIGKINKRNKIVENGKIIGFRIEDSKTVAGLREVPIHPCLKDLHGYLLLSDYSDESIFIVKTNSAGKRLDYLSKRFGRLKTKLGFDKSRAFHSFRSNFINELYNNKVQHELVQIMVGHKFADVTRGTYLDGLDMENKIEAISKISFPLDISRLLALLKVRDGKG